jgi:uncharacterized protein (TIGR00369 family)
MMEKFKKLPVRRNHQCFGCSPMNTAGLKMTFATDGESVISSLKVPEHLCGWDHLVHGGVIATILDEIMSWAALHLLKKIILTKSVSIDFIKPVYIGKMLTAKGRVIKLKSKREALMEGVIVNDSNEICARSQGTFVLFTAEVAKRLNIMDEKALKMFMGIIEGPP